jgi:hypothetical protein
MTPETVKEYLMRLIALCRAAGIDFETCVNAAIAEDYRAQEGGE